MCVCMALKVTRRYFAIIFSSRNWTSRPSISRCQFVHDLQQFLRFFLQRTNVLLHPLINLECQKDLGKSSIFGFGGAAQWHCNAFYTCWLHRLYCILRQKCEATNDSETRQVFDENETSNVHSKEFFQSLEREQQIDVTVMTTLKDPLFSIFLDSTKMRKSASSFTFESSLPTLTTLIAN